MGGQVFLFRIPANLKQSQKKARSIRFCAWRPAIAALLMAFFTTGCGPAKPPATANQPLRPAQTKLLDRFDPLYDPDRRMLQEPFRSPGYHSRTPAGELVHPTRESLIYALALLQRGEAEDVSRATGILREVVKLQDTAPDSPTLGLWPWHAEESLAEMSSPDFNWADFCGALIAHVLVEHGDFLPADLKRDLRTALKRAAEAIRRRDVGAAYTNVAVMGGGVCAVAGELTGDPAMLTYGRERLKAVVARTEYHGNFNEYNSPPYLNVVIAECERILQLAGDQETKAAAETIRRAAWKTIAESFHPATQQIAGPQSRTSRLRLRDCTVDFLSARVGVELQTHPTMLNEPLRGYAVVTPAPCPAEFLPAFQNKGDEPIQLTRMFIRSRTPGESVVGETWMNGDACLGSVNQSSFWTQRKPLIGYWKTAHDPAIAFRMRFLHDGADFASMGVRTVQSGPRCLAMISPLPDRGDWHRTLDRPADGVFYAANFRLRCELNGENVRVEQLEEHVYELSADPYRIVLHTLPGEFMGRTVQWEIGRSDDAVYVDGVCHRSDSQPFRFDGDEDVSLAIGLELISTGELISGQSPEWVRPGSQQKETQWFLPEGETLRLY